MAEYIEREALIREISSDMTLFIGDPDAVQKHDEQCNYAISCVEDAPAVKPEPNWIPVSERLPEEHDSIFMRFYGTEKWKEGMFKKVSDEVNVTIEYVNGSKKVTHCKIMMVNGIFPVSFKQQSPTGCHCRSRRRTQNDTTTRSNPR